MKGKLGALLAALVAILIGGAVALAFIPTLSPIQSPMPCKPPADFTWTTSGLTASFTVGTQGCYASIAWDFGDGAKGSGSPVSHTYSAAGTYTVTMTVTATSGYTVTASHAVMVTSSGTPPPNNTDFTVSTSGLTITVPISGWYLPYVVFDFGDGTGQHQLTVNAGSSGIVGTIQYTYAKSGTYTVTWINYANNPSHSVTVSSFQTSILRVVVAAVLALGAVGALLRLPGPFWLRIVAAAILAILAFIVYMGVLF